MKLKTKKSKNFVDLTHPTRQLQMLSFTRDLDEKGISPYVAKPLNNKKKKK